MRKLRGMADQDNPYPSDSCWIIKQGEAPATVTLSSGVHVLAFADRGELESYQKANRLPGKAAFTNRRDLWESVTGLVFGAEISDNDEGYVGGRPVVGAWDPIRNCAYKRG